MKIYAKRDNLMVEAEVADGAVYLEIGSTDDGKGGRLPPISAIDEDARTICRAGIRDEPFPARFYRECDIDWKPSKIGATAVLDQANASETAS